MSHMSRNLVPILARSSALLRRTCPATVIRSIQTSSTTSGGHGYSELTDYDIHLWDRPHGFIDGMPHKEHFWERRSYNTFLDKYWLALLVGCALAYPYASWCHRSYAECGEEAVKIAEERLNNGVLIDLFPDQKEARLFVANREFFPDHDPHTYDPTIEREYFWIQ